MVTKLPIVVASSDLLSAPEHHLWWFNIGIVIRATINNLLALTTVKMNHASCSCSPEDRAAPLQILFDVGIRDQDRGRWCCLISSLKETQTDAWRLCMAWLNERMTLAYVMAGGALRCAEAHLHAQAVGGEARPTKLNAPEKRKLGATVADRAGRCAGARQLVDGIQLAALELYALRMITGKVKRRCFVLDKSTEGDLIGDGVYAFSVIYAPSKHGDLLQLLILNSIYLSDIEDLVHVIFCTWASLYIFICHICRDLNAGGKIVPSPLRLIIGWKSWKTDDPEHLDKSDIVVHVLIFRRPMATNWQTE